MNPWTEDPILTCPARDCSRAVRITALPWAAIPLVFRRLSQPRLLHLGHAVAVLLACTTCRSEQAQLGLGTSMVSRLSTEPRHPGEVSQSISTSEPDGGDSATSLLAPEADAHAMLRRSRDANATRQLILKPGRRSIRGTSGMVVSVSAEATRIGVEQLKRGGNAVDAAVAVALALAVTHPSAGNLGGGGFALVRLSTGETLALDFRESSPQNLERGRFFEMIRAGGFGADSVAIPGSVAGFCELSSRYGRLPFSSLVAPSRELAAAGHRVSHREALAIRSAWPKLRQQPLLQRLYGTTKGEPLPAGSRIKLPELAATLSVLEEKGKVGFYSGPAADSIVEVLGPAAQISLLDLSAYRAIWRQPLLVPYRGLGVAIMPPPSAGGAALASSLAMLAKHDPRTFPRGSTAHAHLMLEIMRRAQFDRVFGVVDPDTWSDRERTARLSSYLDPERWQKRCPIDSDHATTNDRLVERSDIAVEAEHTTHLAVVDAEGMAVSLTTTLSSAFGSRLVTKTGIVLNNALGSFSGLGENQPLPNRRTTSSMAPTMVEDTEGLRLVVGTPGGDTIPSTLLLLLNALVDYAVPLDQAVDAPRMHQGIEAQGKARIERGRPIPMTLQRGLARLGHNFSQPTAAIGHANTIALIGGYSYGYADPREGGLALGCDVIKQ